MTQIRIGIDCRLAGPEHAGIGRYIEQLIFYLPRIAPHINWVFFYSTSQQKNLLHHRLNFAQIDNVTWKLASVRHYTLAEQLKLPILYAQSHLDLLHVPHFNAPLLTKVPLVLTVHDLLWHEKKGLAVTTLPKWQYWIKYLGYRVITSLAIAKAKKIIVPAQTIKQTVIDHFPSTATKIVSIKEGALASTQLSHSPSVKEKHLLYIGSLYPHKNLSLVLTALSHLPDWQLTCVGSRSAFHQRIQSQISQLGLDHRVKLKGYVPDEEIALLYQQVTALIQPSTSEGFGLTGVEAMASGLPVLASEIPIFKEIYQDGALYFDPNDPKSLVYLLDNLTTAQIRQVSRRGKTVAAQYSWQTMAEQTLALYQELL